MGSTTARDGVGNLFTKAIIGTTASVNAIINTESNASVQFTAVTTAVGVATGATPSYIIITFFVES
jgi:hypothetical protein